jgi:hypothetical protein
MMMFFVWNKSCAALYPQLDSSASQDILKLFVPKVWVSQPRMENGMVHANVGQKLLKRNILKSFYWVSKLRSSR